MNQTTEVASMSADVKQFLSLLHNPDVCEVLHRIIENVLLTSELKPIKRIADLEAITGLNDYSEYDEEQHELTIPEQILMLADRIDNSVIPTAKETVSIPDNKTGVRARLLKNKLVSMPYRNGRKYMISSEVKAFLLDEIELDYRTTQKGARVAAKDVMEKTKELFPDNVTTGKNKKNMNVIELLESKA
jgi:hypothetical protein